MVNPHKPNKVKVVFDAAAEFRGVSLNKKLLRGPNYLASQVGLLLRFQRQPVAISGDIRMMYYQVKVPKEQRAALSFIWLRTGDPEPPKVYRMTVHVFGAVSSPATCLYALRRTAEDNREEYPELAERVVASFYVDNWIDSFATEEEAINCWRRLTEMSGKSG